MKHLLILLLACTFSFPSRGQSIIQLSPLQGGCVKSKNQVFFDILYKKDFISLLC